MMGNDMEHDDRREEQREDRGGVNGAAQNGAASEPPPGAEALAALTAERDELKDRVLRTLAEMENLRRRTEREVADARTYAVTNFARDMLNVADNVRRAVESVPAETRSGADGAFKGLLDGIELTERDLTKTLERHGVKLIEPQGQRFDPNRHQAMFEVPNAEVPTGTVVQVVQSGYVIGDRVLRPALVGVAKGGPKPAAANPSDPG
ncbi:nucleotide exchange factor GrpE [Methylobacterium soli]|uniref:Protein GrpE n=1 Tax=Methylobacterium soli TaxID=553447 RepID=A0A6L3T230_9HYPH|nr:nucleotide exchange factor GrpE [Methylobacterium soli]KAB1079135.1 nucleotide exchange factor GrpE [Methylobacterium soli]GJE43152.1 Protein GrpE [Methylobacterium soli]